jgi:hypothetical protein
MSLLLHCVPGSIAEKSVAFDNLVPHLKPGGVIFGLTVLSVGVGRNLLATRMMALLNARGVFHNDRDSLADIQTALEVRFTDVQVRVVGCFALFSARKG